MIDTLAYASSLEEISRLELDKVEGFDHYAFEYQVNYLQGKVSEYLHVSACDVNGDIITKREYAQVYSDTPKAEVFDIITQIGREAIRPGSEVLLVLYPKQALKITSKDLGLFEIYPSEPFTEVNIGAIFGKDLTTIDDNETKSVTVLYKPLGKASSTSKPKTHPDLPNLFSTSEPTESKPQDSTSQIGVLDKPLDKVKGSVTTVGADESFRNPNIPRTVEDVAAILARTAASATLHVESVKNANVINAPSPTREDVEANHKAALDSFDANMHEFMTKMKQSTAKPIKLDEVREEEAREEIMADEIVTTTEGTPVPVVTLQDGIRAGKIKGTLPKENTSIEQDNGVEPLSLEDDFDFSEKKK